MLIETINLAIRLPRGKDLLNHKKSNVKLDFELADRTGKPFTITIGPIKMGSQTNAPINTTVLF